MFQLKPGTLAMVIGARTAAGRVNIGKAVELFGLCQPGERFVNPVTGVVRSCRRRRITRYGWSPAKLSHLMAARVTRLCEPST